MEPSLGYTNATSSINVNSNRNFWSILGSAYLDIELGKKLGLSSNIDYSFRQKDKFFNANNDYVRWNASVRQFIYKKEISIKLTLNDILNQNRGFDRNFSTYKYSESYFNTLKRYWLVTLAWDFKHAKKQVPAATPNVPAASQNIKAN